MPEVRVCDGCGQSDDHPRVQFDDGANLRLFHFDCTPAYVKSETNPSHPGFAATAAGQRGDDVRSAILATLEG